MPDKLVVVTFMYFTTASLITIWALTRFSPRTARDWFDVVLVFLFWPALVAWAVASKKDGE